ncbi:MAG: MBL fold metallo-hydrolase [Candidatus Andeanibacterium colombiense]|uniref:MBL fold metallo-hydrolase n=1 Tax=Candidatus Andeanibacterium colombiense TaxID=3121345 RepID=A0AAJ6BQD9_9SPHN|nr:MAG: MBL fold metallo-hydrolase [Sphingomonadaceae bacterium]
MKSKMALAFLVAGSMAAAASAQQGAAPAPGAAPAAPPRGGGLPPVEPIQHVTGNVYKIFGGGGNTLVFVQKDGVTLLDTKMPGNGQAILDEVAKVTDKPITTIISTHSHPDHIGSTDFIRAKYPNVRVIMQENALTELASGPFSKPELKPNVTYKDHLTVGSGDDRLELYHFGRGHTEADTFVLIPAARLLFMGDVMAWNMAPFLPSGGASAIADETEKLVNTVKGQVDIVVEGHGYVNDWAGLERLARFDRALITEARKAYDRGEAPGVAVAELRKNPDFSPLLDTHIKKGLEYGNTPLARAHMNVNVAYTEFAGEQAGFGIANGAPLPATDKHKGSDPKDTAPPTPEMLANEVAK